MKEPSSSVKRGRDNLLGKEKEKGLGTMTGCTKERRKQSQVETSMRRMGSKRSRAGNL